MTSQGRSALEPPSADSLLAPPDETRTTASANGGRVPPGEDESPPDEGETLRLWQGIVVGAALSSGLWVPLALMAWWWLR